MITDFKLIGIRVDEDFTKYLLSSISHKNTYCIVSKNGSGRYMMKPNSVFESEESPTLDSFWSISKNSIKIVNEICNSIDIDEQLSEFLTDSRESSLDILSEDL